MASRWLAGLCIGLLFGSMSASSSAASLQLTSLTAAPMAGGSLWLELRLTGLTAGQTLAAYDLDLLFDASRVGNPVTSFGDALGADGIDTFSDSSFTPGRLDFASVSLLDEADLLARQAGGEFVIAQFRFDVLSAGTALFELDSSNALFGDALGNDLAIDLGTPLRLSLLPASGGTVPLPGTLLLSAFAALAAAGTARRR